MQTRQLAGWLGGLWLLLTSCQALPPTEAAQAALDQFTATPTEPIRWGVDGYGRWKVGKLTLLTDMHVVSPGGLPKNAPPTAAVSLHIDTLTDEQGNRRRFTPNNMNSGLASFEQTAGEWYLTYVLLPLTDKAGNKWTLLEFRPRIRLK